MFYSSVQLGDFFAEVSNGNTIKQLTSKILLAKIQRKLKKKKEIVMNVWFTRVGAVLVNSKFEPLTFH